MGTFRQPFRNEWPVTQKYGDRLTSSFHTGIDYGCPLNTPILASSDGRVMFAGKDSTGYGNMVIIQHASDCSTLYAHLSVIYASVGKTVKQSDLIGLSGSSGNSTGPHLHFEARSVWNDYKSHFDPVLLSMISVDDGIQDPIRPPYRDELTDDIPEGKVKIIAPLGAYGHNAEFSSKKLFYFGTELIFTGEKKEHNGLVFCRCVPSDAVVWIAANDGETQILGVK